MALVSDLFTPVDELRLTEPYCSSGGLAVSAGATFSQKTPVMVLDEAARRVYGVPPDYQLISEVVSIYFLNLMDGDVICDKVQIRTKS